MPECKHCGHALVWIDPEYSNGFKGGFVCPHWDFMHDCAEAHAELASPALVLVGKQEQSA